MKTRALFVLMMVSAALHAQQINGSSHLTWNASTGTLTGLAVTSVDGSMGSYYESYVRAQITDENGNLLVINSALDNTGSREIDITVRAQGSPGHNYFMTSFHHAIQEYACGGPLPPAPTAGAPASSCPLNSYVDYFNFYYGVLPTFWSDFGTAEFPNSWYWIGPGPNSYAPRQSLSVAETYSNAQLRTPVTCGDVRDQIAREYVTYASPWLPDCTQFNSNQSTGHYTFAQLNYPSPATAPPEFPWALFTVDFLNGVDRWATDFLLANNYVPHINSGYRDPKQNRAAGGVPGSWHMAGVAADMQNVTRDEAGRGKLTKALLAHTPDAWIEGIAGPCGYACVHGDWRRHPLTWVH